MSSKIDRLAAERDEAWSHARSWRRRAFVLMDLIRTGNIEGARETVATWDEEASAAPLCGQEQEKKG